ncbi:protein of unknown function [Candidatus Methylocalor cossyra]|uniref:Transposase DDE domain-containing protein n=1 Tax=Candidatus Methylocalor cossyra TaxID=3108543 RepID=A0ABM9NJX5_9GAMM
MCLRRRAPVRVHRSAGVLQKAHYEQGEKKLRYAGLCKRLTKRRNSPATAWLADASAHPLQQALKGLERVCQLLRQMRRESRAMYGGGQ